MSEITAAELVEMEPGTTLTATATSVSDPPSWELELVEMTKTGAEIEFAGHREPSRGCLDAYAPGHIVLIEYGDPSEQMLAATRRRGGGPGHKIDVTLTTN